MVLTDHHSESHHRPHADDPAQVEPARPTTRSLVVPSRRRAAHDTTVCEALVAALVKLGVEHAYGVFGGAIAPFCKALSCSPIQLVHCRSEAGAAFAAIESSLASGKLSVALATTGPGLTSLVTGMAAARSEGAHVLFVSGATNAASRGRGAFQETSPHSSGLGALLQPGALLDHAQVVEHADELLPLLARLATGARCPTGFVAHVGLPLQVQTTKVQAVSVEITSAAQQVPDVATVVKCREVLAAGPFAIWAGFGARHAARQVCELAERAAVPVMCTPRAKGVMPETHPLYLGVTGLGGHAQVEEYLRHNALNRVLVLGSGLGEMASFWSPTLAPAGGFVHVDLDSRVFGRAYPQVPTLGIQSDVRWFLSALLEDWPKSLNRVPSLPPPSLPAHVNEPKPRAGAEFVRYSVLMSAIQRVVVEGGSAPIITEAGNSFVIGSHYLSFSEPGRYRVSTQFGSMGQAAAGVIGAAAVHGKAFALVGDGALLMFNELSTAAKYEIPAVWIVLNDARYGMIEDGMKAIGWEPFDTGFPRVDFRAVAQGIGVTARRARHEHELERVLSEAMAARGPYLIDVWIDPTEVAPTNERNGTLMQQGVNGGTVS